MEQVATPVKKEIMHSLTEAELNKRMAALPGERVTPESIMARIDKVGFIVIEDSNLTICEIKMKNGFAVRGESACVDPANFDEEIGKEWAYRNAFEKLWPLEGYLLAERRFQEGKVK